MKRKGQEGEVADSAELRRGFRTLGERLGRIIALQIQSAGTQDLDALVAAAIRQSGVIERLAEAIAVPHTLPPAPARRLHPGATGRRRRRGEPPPPCGKTGCERPARTRGFCQTHYVQWLRAQRAAQTES